MRTLLTQVEACLNSRPIIPLSDDPGDLDALTPAHFLIGGSLQSLPEPDFHDVSTNRLHHWQLTQQKVQQFWKRWSREYLCQLQSRTKRWRPPVKIEVGKLVVVQDENQPPMRWKLGRIETTHPGGDGVVRVVTLRTATGLLKRPVEKLCILPVNQSEHWKPVHPFLSHHPCQRVLFYFQKFSIISGWVRMFGCCLTHLTWRDGFCTVYTVCMTLTPATNGEGDRVNQRALLRSAVIVR